MKNIKAEPLSAGWPSTITKKAKTLNEYIIACYMETYDQTGEFTTPADAAHSLVHYDEMFQEKFHVLFTQYEDRLDLEYGLEEHISALIIEIMRKQFF